METLVVLEHWDHPIFSAEPNGFTHIRILLREPSQNIKVRASIPLKDAKTLGERLIRLSDVLEEK